MSEKVKRVVPQFKLSRLGRIAFREALCDAARVYSCPKDGCVTCMFDAPIDEFAEWLKEQLR